MTPPADDRTAALAVAFALRPAAFVVVVLCLAALAYLPEVVSRA